MDLVIKGLSDLTSQMIEKNPKIESNEAKNNFYNLCSNFKTDEIFQNMFPIIFQIEKIKYMQANENKELSKPFQ